MAAWSRSWGVVSLAIAVGVALSCAPPGGNVSWNFAFANDQLRQETSALLAEIRQGDCTGRAVFQTWISRSDGTASTPGTLSGGHYGFYGRAQTKDCKWIAEGCTNAVLPARGPVNVLLVATPNVDTDPACGTNTDTDNATADGDDGPPGDGTSSGDGDGDGDSTPNGGGDGDVTPTPGHDAGGVQPGPGNDAGAGTPDAGHDAGTTPVPSTSQCESLDNAVVACFDFNGSLKDASRFANDASGTAKFESSEFGQALRANGNPIVVQEDTSLDLVYLTVEAWIRIDSLQNLTGATNENSLIMDKDQQYLIGITPKGAALGQFYRAQDDEISTQSNDSTVRTNRNFYIAYTYDGAVARLYVDGEQKSQTTAADGLFAGISGTMHIGSGSPGTTKPFDGLIDALRISNRARSATEICEAAGKALSGGQCN
jgi:hypothetical protein